MPRTWLRLLCCLSNLSGEQREGKICSGRRTNSCCKRAETQQTGKAQSCACRDWHVQPLCSHPRCKVLPQAAANMAPGHWDGPGSGAGFPPLHHSWQHMARRQLGSPIPPGLDFIPAPTSSLCARSCCGSLAADGAGTGWGRKGVAGTRELSIPACPGWAVGGFQPPAHCDHACKVARREGHGGLPERSTSVSNAPTPGQGVRWFSPP